MKRPVQVSARVRVRLSCLLDEALEGALASASHRVFKHDDAPIATPEVLVARVEEHLRNAFWGGLEELGVEIE